MTLLVALTIVAGLCALGEGQSSALPPVSHRTPFPGNYTGQYRPQVHYSPPQNFMNDPNGCFRDDGGTWHLYYQCKKPFPYTRL